MKSFHVFFSSLMGLLILAACSSPVTASPQQIQTQVALALAATQSAYTPTPGGLSPEQLASLPKFVWRVKANTNPNIFSKPGALALDSQGNLYLWNGGDLRVEVFDNNGKHLTSWGGRGNADGQFNTSGDYPYGSIAIDEQGNVYVIDYGNDRVQKFDRQGKFIAKWGTHGDGDGEFILPFGVAVDSKGRVYVVDDGTARLQIFDGEGHFLSKFGGRGTADGKFQNPSYITVDNQGNVYIPDVAMGRVQEFNSSGGLVAKWNTVCGSGQEFLPVGIAVNGNGNVYITDHNNARVCVFDNKGNFLFTWGSRGTEDGQLTDPSGIAIDDQGNIYVAGALPPFVEKFKLP